MRVFVLLMLLLAMTGLSSNLLAQAGPGNAAPANPAPADPMQMFQQDDAMANAGDINPALYYWQAIAAYYAVPSERIPPHFRTSLRQRSGRTGFWWGVKRAGQRLPNMLW